MFSPVETTVGALLLQQAATGYLFKNGKVLGASGLLRELLLSQTVRSVLFISGMISSRGLVHVFVPELSPGYPSSDISRSSVLVYLFLGLLTGSGTKMCGGCTSGHMLCGISRLSPRSVLAVSIFFPIAAVFFSLGYRDSLPLPTCVNSLALPCYVPAYPSASVATRLILLASVTLAAYHGIPRFLSKSSDTGGKDDKNYSANHAATFLTGVTFGLGLLVSGMASPFKVLSFFAFQSPQNWDPSLMLVVVFGVLPSLLYYKLRGTNEPPKYADKFDLPTLGLRDTNARFVLGAVLFGASWGLSGICPGPAILRLVGQPKLGALWMAGFWLGSLIS